MGHHDEGSSEARPSHHHHGPHLVQKRAKRTGVSSGRSGVLNSVSNHVRESKPIRASLRELDMREIVQAKDDFIVTWLSDSKAQARGSGPSLQAEQSAPRVFRNGPKHRILAGRSYPEIEDSEDDDHHQVRRPPAAHFDAPESQTRLRVNKSSDDLVVPTVRDQREPQYEKRSRNRTRTDRYDHGHGKPLRRRDSQDEGSVQEEKRHRRKKKKTLESSKDIANNFSSEVILNGRVSTCPSIRPGIILNGHASTVEPLADLCFRPEKPRVYGPRQESLTLSHSRQSERHGQSRELEEASAFFTRTTSHDQGPLVDRPQRKGYKRDRVDSHDSTDTHVRVRHRGQKSRPHRERRRLPEESLGSRKVEESSEVIGQRQSSKPGMTRPRSQETPETMSSAKHMDTRSQASITPASVCKLLAETGVFKGIERFTSQPLETRSNTIEDSRDDTDKQALMNAQPESQDHIQGKKMSQDSRAAAKEDGETDQPSQDPRPRPRPQPCEAKDVSAGDGHLQNETHACLLEPTHENNLSQPKIQESGMEPLENKASHLPRPRDDIVHSAYLGLNSAPLEPPLRPKAPKLSIISHLEATAASPELDTLHDPSRPTPKLGTLSHMEANAVAPGQDAEYNRTVPFEYERQDMSIPSRGVREWFGSAFLSATPSRQGSNPSENSHAFSESSSWVFSHNYNIDVMPYDQLRSRQPRVHFSQAPGNFSHDMNTVPGAFSEHGAAEDMGEYIRRIEEETCETRPHSPVWHEPLHDEHYTDYPIDNWSNAEGQFGASLSARYQDDLDAGAPQLTELSGLVDVEPQNTFETKFLRQPDGEGGGSEDHCPSMTSFWRPNPYMTR